MALYKSDRDRHVALDLRMYMIGIDWQPNDRNRLAVVDTSVGIHFCPKTTYSSITSLYKN